MSVIGSDNMRGILRTIPQERAYPDPQTLPAQPSWQQPSVEEPAGVQKFIENKKSTLKARMDEVANKAIQDLRIGDLRLGSGSDITEQRMDIQAQLLQETRQKLFGRNVSARGSIISVHDELWLLPNQIQFS